MIIHNNQRPLHSGLLSEDLASFDLANGCFINVSFGSRNFVCLITFSLFFPLAGWATMLNDKHLCLALFWSSFSYRDLRFHLLVLTLFALYHKVSISFAFDRLISIFLSKRQNRYEYRLLSKKWNDFLFILLKKSPMGTYLVMCFFVTLSRAKFQSHCKEGQLSSDQYFFDVSILNV